MLVAFAEEWPLALTVDTAVGGVPGGGYQHQVSVVVQDHTQAPNPELVVGSQEHD